ncbi:MAG: SMC-Scp complex subunit ScpB [Anaerolineae bacterium]|nr:SMC-Scp complex subunit ScpB [Anaerolineae bacterium]MDK1117257.1 SMC-Scp complex subunit ScpB [Anaerolineae bacterium]
MNKNSIKTDPSLATRIEAILFVAVEPVSPKQISSVLDATLVEVNQAVKDLEESYKQSGLRLQHHSGRIQLTTAPDTSEAIENYLGLEAISRLSRAALETLAIIAYKQPVTRPQVDSIRGVNSDGVMRSLLSKGLIQEGGRAEGPGRPVLYSTTPDFLQHFGLNSLTELPPLDYDKIGGQAQSMLKG